MIEIVTAALLAIVLQGDAPVVGSVEVCPGVLRVEHLVEGEIVTYHKDIATGAVVPSCE